PAVGPGPVSARPGRAHAGDGRWRGERTARAAAAAADPVRSAPRARRAADAGAGDRRAAGCDLPADVSRRDRRCGAALAIRIDRGRPSAGTRTPRPDRRAVAQLARSEPHLTLSPGP